ncbi:MAG TPA: TonB-dependent receptor [Steroidobacteraceae bacterium]|nr:TonB-dependent receptor [Steroidobacteraceae bacterium]
MSMRKPVRALLFLSTFGSAATHAADPASSIDTIVISASPITPEDKLATIVETVDRDEILRAGGANLADALANTPGVTGSGFASGASRPVIRGFDSNRVRTLEDGIGSFDVADVGPDHGIPIDPLSAQRIEVIRGAATLRYGSQAIGGVINAINNRVPARLPDKPFAAELTGLYGTNADTRQGSALLDGRIGAFAVHADGFRREADDYEIPGGTMANSFFRGDGYSLGGSYLFDKNRVGAAVIHYDSAYGIPGEGAFIDMEQTKELLRASFAPQIGTFQTLTIEGGHADYEHSEIALDTGEVGSTFKDDEWDARAEALFGAVGPFSAAALGMQFQNRQFAALGEGADYLLPTETRTAAAFAFADAPLSTQLHLHVGARVEAVDVDGTPLDDVPTTRSFTPVSASAGLLFEASEALQLGLTLSSAARAPGQTELYARGPHEATGTFEIGNPGFDEERANSLEATLRYDTKSASFEAAVWGSDFTDYIFGNLTGRTCDDEGICVDDDGGELDELIYEQRDATYWGAEARATVELAEAAGAPLRGIVLADYVRAKLDGGGEVPRISPYHVGLGLNWDGQRIGGGFLVKYTGPREDNLAQAETPTAGFVSVDAQATWRPLEKRTNFEITLVGRNLTDRVQRNAVSLNKDEVILPGREVRLLVRAML